MSNLNAEVKKEVVKKMDLIEGEVITILEGSAPKQHNTKPVSISGNIDAPSRFIENRTDCFDHNKAHCIVSTEEGTVTLEVNEQDHCDNYIISGKLELAKDFKELGINTGKRYTAEKLAQTFKLKRSIFESWDDHANICATLRNLKAKVNREVDEHSNDRGDRMSRFNQTVESNMPESFRLNLPLIKGGEKELITINVVLEADGKDIVCFLDSVEGQEKLDHAFETKVLEEAKKIEKTVLVIFK